MRRLSTPGRITPEKLPDWTLNWMCWPEREQAEAAATAAGDRSGEWQIPNFMAWIRAHHAWLAANAPHITPREQYAEHARRWPVVDR